MFTYSRPYDVGTSITLNTEFPMYSEDMVNYTLDGYPYFLNYERWHISLITGSFVNHEETKTVVLPVLCAPFAIETGDYEDVGELDIINDEDMSIMIKVNEEGVITALMMQNKIFFGTGFPSDSDWEPIIQYYPTLVTQQTIQFVPIALFQTYDDSKFFLYFKREPNNVITVKYCLVDNANDCDFSIKTTWNEFSAAFTYVTDIHMSTFNICQAQRDQFLESSKYGLLAYVTR